MFDAAIDMGKGSDINLVVTQPRRISAISVAERISQERVETERQTDRERERVRHRERGEERVSERERERERVRERE